MAIWSFNYGSTHIPFNMMQPSGWQFVTSESKGASYGEVITVGGGTGSFTVQVTEGSHRRDQQYRLRYGGGEVTVGAPIPGPPVSPSYSSEDMPSGAYGQIYRLPGSPGPAGEGGPPTGFLGKFLILSVNAGAGFVSSRAVMLLGAIDFPGTQTAFTFKYLTLLYGVSYAWATLNASGFKGVISSIEKR